VRALAVVAGTAASVVFISGGFDGPHAKAVPHSCLLSHWQSISIIVHSSRDTRVLIALSDDVFFIFLLDSYCFFAICNIYNKQKV
jgi:hypothetical protein